MKKKKKKKKTKKNGKTSISFVGSSLVALEQSTILSQYLIVLGLVWI
jgi:hypothetical protein